MKLKEFDLYDILEKYNNGFYDWHRLPHINKTTGKKYYGTAFKLIKPISDEPREALKDFTNISFGHARTQYAPELKTSVIFLWDVKLKNNRGIIACYY